MTVLVAAASKHGATDEIAERIGADLAEHGIDADVKRLNEVEDLSEYDAFVLGSAIFYGKWMKEAISFVDAHAGELSERPTWLFGSGSITGNPPIAEDPKGMLARLIDKLVSSTHAREHKLFAGKLDSSKLSLAEKLPVRMARCREGDWRDWQAVDEWAAAIAQGLQTTPDGAERR
jgi:menaquinone-dependent protoporphyrinogen oxidase